MNANDISIDVMLMKIEAHDIPTRWLSEMPRSPYRLKVAALFLEQVGRLLSEGDVAAAKQLASCYEADTR